MNLDPRQHVMISSELKHFFAHRSSPLTIRCRLALDRSFADDAGGPEWAHLFEQAESMIGWCSDLTGVAPTRVFAEQGNDAVSISLRYEDQSIATIQCGPRLSDEVTDHIEVMGGGRFAVLDDFKTLELSSGRRTRTDRPFESAGRPMKSSGESGRPRTTLALLRSLATGRPIEISAV